MFNTVKIFNALADNLPPLSPQYSILIGLLILGELALVGYVFAVQDQVSDVPSLMYVPVINV